MSIIVEDGTGLATAESYCSVDYADTHHTARQNTVWTGAVTLSKEAALRKASDYMLQTYRLKWAGSRVKTTQALDWPRYDVPMTDTAGGYKGMQPVWSYVVVPDPVQRACAELASRVLQGGGAILLPDLERVAKREKVDVLETEYADGRTPHKTFPAIDRLLAPFFAQSGYVLGVVRA